MTRWVDSLTTTSSTDLARAGYLIMWVLNTPGTSYDRDRLATAGAIVRNARKASTSTDVCGDIRKDLSGFWEPEALLWFAVEKIALAAQVSSPQAHLRWAEAALRVYYRST